MKKSAPEPGESSPIAFVPASNGERLPPEKDARDRREEEVFARMAHERARKLGVSRRELVSCACGAAAALVVINHVYGCGTDSGARAGTYAVGGGSTLVAAKACEQIGGSEFVFDVQTHCV